MLSKIRSFSKSKFAGVLVGIIIIPFVFWGMGSVFSGGNKNSIAKIDNVNISTQDFIDYINLKRINTDYIKKNIDNEILDKILSNLISINMLDIEVNNLQISISDESLVDKIKNDKNFFDENNKFSRTKYEKFLISNNIPAPSYESELKKKELQNKLFYYIGGGIKLPHFIINKVYIDETKKVDIEFINLEYIYKNEFTDKEVNAFIKDNEDLLKKDYIDFSYIKIDPQKLVQSNEFNKEFFKKIDEIENSILNGFNIDQIKNKYNLATINKNNYTSNNEEDEILNEIYLKRNQEKIQLIDKNDYYLLYEIKKINKILPDKNNTEFIEQVSKKLYLKEKYDYNQDLLLKIQNKKFSNDNFINLTKNKDDIKSMRVNSIKDISIFETNSIKLLYSMPTNSFLLMSDINKNIYVVKIKKIEFDNLLKNSEEFTNYSKQTKKQITNSLYNSYDYLLNDKYKIKINQNTLERVKNYFR